MCASNAALVDVDPAKERNRNNAQRIRFKFHGLRQMTRRLMVDTVEPFPLQSVTEPVLTK
jgi:hypothetical protein